MILLMISTILASVALGVALAYGFCSGVFAMAKIHVRSHNGSAANTYKNSQSVDAADAAVRIYSRSLEGCVSSERPVRLFAPSSKIKAVLKLLARALHHWGCALRSSLKIS